MVSTGKSNMRKSQFKLLRKQGGSRVLAVGTLLPLDWQMVQIVKLDCKEDGAVILKFIKIA